MRQHRDEGITWEAVLCQYDNMVRQVCFSYEKEPSRLEDLTQDVWARVWEKHDQFNGGSDFGTWVHAVAESVCRNYLRYKETEPEIYFLSDLEQSVDTSEELDFDSEPTAEDGMVDDYGTPEEWAQAESTAQAIDSQRDITRLKWVVLNLHVLQDRSIDEIAEDLGVEATTVRTHLQRAREAIQRLLD